MIHAGQLTRPVGRLRACVLVALLALGSACGGSGGDPLDGGEQLDGGEPLDRTEPGDTRGPDDAAGDEGPDVEPSSACYQQVSVADNRFARVTRTDGTLWCWGRNDVGQLCVPGAALAPTLVAVLPDAAQISTAQLGSCLVKRDGSLWCWGTLGVGQVLELGNEVAQVGVGNGVACAVKTDGTEWCFGGAFGVVPVQVLDQVTAVALGYEHGCALRTDGTVLCAGSNEFGQLGDGTLEPRTSAVQVTMLAGVRQIAAGTNHTCAVLEQDGSVWCWGSNADGELGDGTLDDQPTPVQALGVSGAVQVTAGGAHSCALLGDKTVTCWGKNVNGQLGTGDFAGSTVPLPVAGLAGVAQVSAGLQNTCAVAENGGLHCWGSNFDGELGIGVIDGSLDNLGHNTPTVVAPPCR